MLCNFLSPMWPYKVNFISNCISVTHKQIKAFFTWHMQGLLLNCPLGEKKQRASNYNKVFQSNSACWSLLSLFWSILPLGGGGLNEKPNWIESMTNRWHVPKVIDSVCFLPLPPRVRSSRFEIHFNFCEKNGVGHALAAKVVAFEGIYDMAMVLWMGSDLFVPIRDND